MTSYPLKIFSCFFLYILLNLYFLLFLFSISNFGNLELLVLLKGFLWMLGVRERKTTWRYSFSWDLSNLNFHVLTHSVVTTCWPAPYGLCLINCFCGWSCMLLTIEFSFTLVFFTSETDFITRNARTSNNPWFKLKFSNLRCKCISIK